MGQQQLLLIGLGVIVVGIAVAIGIYMFGDSSASSNRDAVTSDLLSIASRAHQYYRRPGSMGGGDCSFSDITFNKLGAAQSNPNGRFLIHGAPTSSRVVIRGIGKEKVNVSDTVTVDMRVTPDSALPVVVH